MYFHLGFDEFMGREGLDDLSLPFTVKVGIETCEIERSWDLQKFCLQ